MNKKLLTFALAIFGLSASAQTYSSASAVNIPDGPGCCGTDGTPILSTIAVPLTATITDPDQVTINMNLTESFAGDIALELVAPDGTSCFLINHLGADGGCGGTSVTFDAANTFSFNSTYPTPMPTAIDPVPAGNYAPSGGTFYTTPCDLSTFLAGKAVNGNWSIRGTDNWGGAPGIIESWSLVFGATALPLQLISFSGEARLGQNNLIWKTGVEKGTAYFELERSQNGSHYFKVATLAAIGSGNNTYRQSDIYNNDLTAYYKLKIVDFDGKSAYSHTLRISPMAATVHSSFISPNPAKEALTLTIGDNTLIGSKTKLIDLMGKILEIFEVQGMVQQIDISRFPASVYTLRLANGETIKFNKID